MLKSGKRQYKFQSSKIVRMIRKRFNKIARIRITVYEYSFISIKDGQQNRNEKKVRLWVFYHVICNILQTRSLA